MKAILLAGGKGTRLRPLTIHTPKPIVPIFDRAFLHYQIDLLRQVPEIDEVILSLNYQPRRIEEIFGDGAGTGLRIRYVVEPAPLGTGGAIRYAAQGITDTLVVFNGDVMTSVNVQQVVDLHRSARRPRHHRPHPGGQPVRLRPGRDARRRRGETLSREAGGRRNHLRHHQRRHLRARTRHLRPHPEGRGLLDRARLLPVAGRAWRAVRRLRRPRLLDRHRHAGEVRAGAPRHVRRPLRRRAVRDRGPPPADRVARGARSTTASAWKPRASSIRAPKSRRVPSSARIRSSAAAW